MKTDYTPNLQRAWVAAAVGAALGTVGTIGANLSGDKTRRELSRLGKNDPKYTESPIAKQRLGLAQTLLNARMPGAVAQERNIYGAQANQLANVNQNATDSSQALALSAGALGQTNEAFNQLGAAEAQDYYNRLANLTGAQEGMIREGDKLYQDQVRRWQDQVNISLARHGIRAQQGQNMSNLGSMIGSMGGMGGGMGGGAAGGASGGGGGK